MSKKAQNEALEEEFKLRCERRLYSLVEAREIVVACQSENGGLLHVIHVMDDAIKSNGGTP